MCKGVPPRLKTWWQPVRHPATVLSVGDKEGLSEVAFVTGDRWTGVGDSKCRSRRGPQPEGRRRRWNCILKTQGQSSPRAPQSPGLRRHLQAEQERERNLLEAT